MSPSVIVSFADQQPEFISLEEAKAHLKTEDSTYEDALVEGLIDAAIADAENYMGKFIKQRNVTVQFKSFPDVYEISRGPYLSDLVVNYLDAVGGSQPLADVYQFANVDGMGEVFFQGTMDPLPVVSDRWNAVTFTYTAGMTSQKFPADMKAAVKLIIAELYEYRTDRKEVNMTRAYSLLRPYKYGS